MWSMGRYLEGKMRRKAARRQLQENNPTEAPFEELHLKGKKCVYEDGFG